MIDDQYIGYLKYSGQIVDSGFFDARKSAQALLGFDEAIRFFVGEQNPDLKNVDFELPVEVRKGSWEILIPGTIGQWVLTSVGAMAAAYLAVAGKKMAENDVKNTLSMTTALGLIRGCSIAPPSREPSTAPPGYRSGCPRPPRSRHRPGRSRSRGA